MNRPVRSLVVLAAVLLALSGCAQSPNTAAIVNGTRVTESQIDAISLSASSVVQAQSGAIRKGVLQYEIWGVLARQIAADTNTEITQKDLDGVIAQGTQLTQLADDPRTRPLAENAARLIYLSTVIEKDDFLNRLTAAKIEVNPKYGAWSPNQLAVTGESGSLSVASQLG